MCSLYMLRWILPPSSSPLLRLTLAYTHLYALLTTPILSVAYNITTPLCFPQPEHALRILKAIMEPMHTAVIHVDRKAEGVSRRLQELVAADPMFHGNVFFVPRAERIACNWGGYSIVEATLNTMRFAMHHTDRAFHYVVDVSGAHYPIKSNEAIRGFLAQAPHKVPDS